MSRDGSVSAGPRPLPDVAILMGVFVALVTIAARLYPRMVT